MNAFRIIIAGLWIAFFGYWAFSARGNNLNTPSVRRGFLVRLAIIVVLLLAFRSGAFHRAETYTPAVADHPIPNTIGVVLSAIGIGIAIWARRHLGRNWGMPMMVRENTELVTTGPYAYVRHPIYSGMLLAMLGSSLVKGISWLILFVLFGVYFVLGALAEERTMTRKFPEAYPAYQRRSKMLIPFVL